MIKFFRKIRQSLLTENKFGKYLLYAIGEIILVVIGILIALSFNNRNEIKKRGIIEIKILKEIKSELIETLIDLNDDLEDHQRNLESAEIIYNSVLLKEDFNDSLRKHYLYMLDRETISSKQSAFQSLQSIGLEIITNDSIRQEITTVYLNIEEIPKKLSDADKTIDKLENLIEPYLIIDRNRIFSDPDLATKTYWGLRKIPFKFDDYSAFLKDERFLCKLMNSIQWRHIQIYFTQQFKKEIDKVIEDIEKELRSLEMK